MTKKPKAAPLAAVREEHARLAAEIAGHDRRYHQEDQPTISDADYDALRRRYDALEAAHPELADALSISAKVGAAPSEKFAKVKHAVPMLSLGNIFADEEVEEFCARVRRFLGLDESAPLALSPSPRSTACRAACATRTAHSSRRRRAATATRARTSPPTSARSPQFLIASRARQKSSRRAARSTC